MRPADETHKRAPRDTRQILDAASVGIRHADNVGPVATLRYLHASAPYTVPVSTPGGSPPVEVRVARAVNRVDDTRESGCRITWTWARGALTVSAIDVSDTADEYDVTLWLTMG